MTVLIKDPENTYRFQVKGTSFLKDNLVGLSICHVDFIGIM